MSELCSELVTRLDLLAEAALVLPSPDAKKLRTTVRTLRDNGFAEQADAVEASIPEAVTVDKGVGDSVATALTILHPDDEAAKLAIARWIAVRPSRGRSGPRKATASDNPKTTWVSVYFDGACIKKYMRSSGGAITSLRFPAWEAMRDFRQPLSEAAWKGCIEDFNTCIYGSGGEFAVGDFTIEVKV